MYKRQDQFISEKDKKDYMNYRDGYCKAINEPLADTINTIQLTAYGNELLSSTFDKVQERLIGSLNDFIHRHSNEPNGIYNYEMQSEVDYLLFSAIKTIKTMTVSYTHLDVYKRQVRCCRPWNSRIKKAPVHNRCLFYSNILEKIKIFCRFIPYRWFRPGQQLSLIHISSGKSRGIPCAGGRNPVSAGKYSLPDY